MINTITLSNTMKAEYIYIVYKDNFYFAECKTIADIARVLRISKSALHQHLIKNGYPTRKADFTYKNYTIEYFNINEYID